MPKCTINGKEVEVKQGTSVIEAFKQSDQDIAHYCYHPGLSVAGCCRLCMVEIEGNPRLQIACNTPVHDGMVINNNSDKVKETVRWGLDFHLINHPLDCPICDQAGECGLQEQYMKFGAYDPEMAEPKVKKRKAVDLGSKIVLDTERCILCSRCVRFTAEVTKTNELGIFNRGDRSEIGTFENNPLENNYAVNTVDICPVGALTSKDFRFRQRVWYLENAETICTGCSTGCNVKVYYNEEGMFRVKPVYNEQVNGHWMCDEGREVYKFVNKDARLLRAKKGHVGQWTSLDAGEAAKEVNQHLESINGDKVAIVVTGQYTSEEYEAFLGFAKDKLKTNQVYHWVNNPENFEQFDGLLLRGDRNPNTKGLLKALDENGFEQSWESLMGKLDQGQVDTLIVAGPENQRWYPDMDGKVKHFGEKVKNLIWLTAGKNESLDQVQCQTWQIPLKTFVEKNGTYMNHQGLEQKVKRVTTVVPGALSLADATHLMAGDMDKVMSDNLNQHIKTNYLVGERGTL